MSESKIQTYLYDDVDDYQFDTDKIEIVDNKAKLKLQQGTNNYDQDYSDPGDFTYEADKVEFVAGKVQQKAQTDTEDYNQLFSSDSGFTYDSAKAEFVGGVVRQKDQRPSNATFGANYDSDINGNWGDGTLTGTPDGGASVSGGKLDLTGSADKWIEYDANSNADSIQVGAVRFKITPDYSGSPGSDQWLFSIGETDSSVNNVIMLRHSSSGPYLRLHIYDSTGALIAEQLHGIWSPTQSQEYEFEINWDLTTGATRIFIDGVQSGSTGTHTGTRDSDINFFRIGQAYNSATSRTNEFKIDDLLYFSTVQHTSNYTPGYTVPDNAYASTDVTCPNVAYTKNPSSFTEPTITDTETPRYTVNGYYYNGADWIASSDTYATAMIDAVWIANYDSFPSGQLGSGVIVKIYFPDSNDQHSVDEIDFDINVFDYATTNVTCPEIEHIEVGHFLMATDFNTTDGEDPRYTIQLDQSGDYLYWNGSAWAVSDGSWAQSTDASTFDTNIEDLPIVDTDYAQFKIHFNTGLNQMWVDLTTLEILESIGYPMDGPKIKPVNRLSGSEIITFMEKATFETDTSLLYTIEIDGQEKYWNGSEVVDSDGTKDQANTAITLNDNILEFLTENCLFKHVAYLVTTDATYTPYLNQNKITYYETVAFRDSLNEILIFIGAETLTDAEFDSLTIDEDSTDEEVYAALLDILEEREAVSTIISQLYNYFLAKGADITEAEGSSNIFVGASLED